MFLEVIETLPRPVRILDVGGTQRFWEVVGLTDPAQVEVVIGNLREMPTRYANFSSEVVDARSLRFEDEQFDVVFSNSVIEHVGTLDDQRKMAAEVRRVGKRYFVQTPNRYFPIEPHFYFPWFQFLPVSVRVLLVHWLPLSLGGPITDRAVAREKVEEIRLMTFKEIQAIFPGAVIRREKVLGLTKSFMIHAER
jgi:SAM-dependent methyltransferase